MVAVHKGRPLAPWPDLNGVHLVSGCDTIKARQAGTGNLMATRAGMRARSYHASPGEIRSVGGVHKLVDELCKYPGWRCDARRYARTGPLAALPAHYQRKCG